MDLKEHIRNVPDFPKEGIVFRDITTLLSEPIAFDYTVDALCDRYRTQQIDAIVGVEARGFIFAGAVAHTLGIGFVPVRKPGKLPAETIEETYELEYGTDALQIHKDAIEPGMRVVVMDDLIAIGGTLEATCKLVERLGGTIVEVAVVIELSFLDGRKKLGDRPFYSMVQYDSE
jgi:adenine phosphoribosyltransferase